jgi:hypothetical protein
MEFVSHILMASGLYSRGVDNHSPNVSGIQDWRVKIQTHLPVWRVVFSPLTDPFYIFGQLFFNLASENTEVWRVS